MNKGKTFFDENGFMERSNKMTLNSSDKIFCATEEIGVVWAKKFEKEESIKEGNKKASHLMNKIKLPPPFYSSRNFLKRTVYEMGLNLLEYQKPDILRDAVEKQIEAYNRRSVHGYKIKSPKNPFYTLLNMVQAWEKGSDGSSYVTKKFTQQKHRNERSRFARQLNYARKNNVPTEFLVGFIYQIGGTEVIDEKIKKGEVEKWLVGC